MREFRQQIEILIEKAADSSNASSAMQYAQAAQNCANAITNMRECGLLNAPTVITVAALEELLHRAKTSPSQSISIYPPKKGET